MDPTNEQPQSTQPPAPGIASLPPAPMMPQAAPQKSRKPLVIVIIVSGVGALCLMAATVAFILLLARDSQTATEGTTQSRTSYQKYLNPAVEFDYPGDWKFRDTSNSTRIVGDRPVTDQAVIVSSQDEPQAMIDYFMQGSSTTTVDYSKRLAAMTQAITAQQQFTPSQLLATRTTAGFGCTKNAKYVEAPKLVERDKLVGMHYTYTCTSAFGPTEGTYMVWYDEHGNKHSFTMNILEPADATYRDFSSHVIDSIKVL